MERLSVEGNVTRYLLDHTVVIAGFHLSSRVIQAFKMSFGKKDLKREIQCPSKF